MTSKELTELIHQNTRIILPEFGAFLVKDGGDKGFNPANVSFSPFLRYNDGMIEIYVAKSRGISKEEAAKDVQQFVETIKNELLEKGTFEVDGLGYLKRDQRGSLSFTLSQSNEKKKSADTSTDESLISKKEASLETTFAQKKSDEKIDVELVNNKPIDNDDLNAKKSRKVAGPKAKVEKSTTKKETKTSKKVDVLSQEPIQNDQPLTDIEVVDVVKTPKSIIDEVREKPIEIETSKREIIIETPIKPMAEPERKPHSESTPTKKKSFAGLIYTVIVLGIIVLLFFVVRNYYFPPDVDYINDSNLTKSKPESIINDKNEASDKVDKPKDEIDKAFNEQPKENKATKEKLKKEKEQEDAIANSLIKNAQSKNVGNKSTVGGVRYCIIAGSFKNPDFANKFMNELSKSGYDAYIVIQPSGMNAVNIGSYSTREEANQAMKGFKSKLPNLWILKK